MTELVRYLAGTWTLERRATDRYTGLVHHMAGQARYTITAEGLAYAERVRWIAPDGTPLRGERHYTIVALGPWSAEVRFADGRHFYALDLAAGWAEVAHACPPDHYRGRYTLDGPNRHRTHWTVTGPRKDLTLVTTFTRLPASPDRRDARSQLE